LASGNVHVRWAVRVPLASFVLFVAAPPNIMFRNGSAVEPRSIVPAALGVWATDHELAALVNATVAGNCPLVAVPEISLKAGCVALGTPEVEIVLIHLLVTAAKLSIPPRVEADGFGNWAPVAVPLMSVKAGWASEITPAELIAVRKLCAVPVFGWTGLLFASGNVNVLAAVAVPVILILLVAAPPTNIEPQGNVAVPRLLPPAVLGD